MPRGFLFFFTAPDCTAVGVMRGIGRSRCGGRSNRPVNLLVSLSQKNRDRKACYFFVISEETSIYNNRAQKRFHYHDPDVLHHRLWPVDKVRLAAA
jgi:hypothetical protein